MWSTTILVILATASLVYSAPPRSLNADKRCACNGLVDSRGEGQCRSSIGGRAFCYVDPGTCSDQVVSSTEGRWETVKKGFGQERQWSFHWRSHIACEEEITELSTTDDLSGINFPQRETVRRPTTITTTTTPATTTKPFLILSLHVFHSVISVPAQQDQTISFQYLSHFHHVIHFAMANNHTPGV